MSNLSSAAQAVLNAVCDNTEPDCDTQHLIAAALRAAINQVLPIEHEIIDDCWYEKADPIREQFLAIATELEGA
jgi:hypothetical protein